MLVVCVLVWSLVSVALALLLGRAIAFGQGRDLQRQSARPVASAAVPAPRSPALAVVEPV